MRYKNVGCSPYYFPTTNKANKLFCEERPPTKKSDSIDMEDRAHRHRRARGAERTKYLALGAPLSEHAVDTHGIGGRGDVDRRRARAEWRVAGLDGQREAPKKRYENNEGKSAANKQGHTELQKSALSTPAVDPTTGSLEH